MKKEKLKTSQEICNRLRWDPQFNESDFTIIYEGRFEGTCEISLPEFRYSEIPWHRVLSIKGPMGVLWDRALRLDRICGSGNTPPRALLSRTEEEPSSNIKTERDETLFSILSMNVLFDCYDDVDVRAKERWPHLLNFLESKDCSLIALQEVTPSFFALLKEKEWFKEEYHCCDTNEEKRITPFGPLLLSKKTIIDTYWPAVGRGNRVLLTSIKIDDIDVKVGVLHLTSDYRKKKAKHRQRELGALLENMGQGPALIMGDFNFSKEEETEILSENGFTDLWSKLNPEAPGFTYAPDSNELARQSTITGRSSRLDRIYLRGDLLVPQSISLAAQEPVADTYPPLFLSDHYGLHCRLKTRQQVQTVGQPSGQGLLSSKRVHRTALCLIPPRHLWPAIEAMRHQYDRQYLRWPPHINLLYGFIPEEDFPKAQQILKSKLAQFEPFELSLKEFNRFEHHQSSTIWLEPISEPAGRLQALQKLLEESFPQCDEQSTRSPMGFTPHLSVGQLQKNQSFHHSFTPLTFQVNELALISRRKEEPFARRAIVALREKGASATAAAKEATDHRAHRLEVTDTLVNYCRLAAGGECVVTGSTLLDCFLEKSDIDLVVLGPTNMSVSEFTKRLQEHISSLISYIEDAKAPLLCYSYQGFKVEVAFTNCPETLAPRPLTEYKLDELQKFDEVSQLAIRGYLNTLALVKDLPPHKLALFQQTLRSLRKWASNRLIDNGAFGFLPGYSWSLLSRWVIDGEDPTNPQEALKKLFATLHQWDFVQPIGLTKEARAFPLRPRDKMAIVTSIAPLQNSARNVTSSTLKELKREFQRAHECCEKDDWELLFKAKEPDKDELVKIEISFSASHESELQACHSWFRKSALSLVLSLEQELGCHALCYDSASNRNEAATKERATYNIYIKEAAPKPLTKIFKNFTEQFEKWAHKPADTTISFLEHWPSEGVT
jgi:poly(A) polymerase